LKSFPDTAKNAADAGTVERAERQLERCATQIAALSDELADAKQILEFDGDRRKRALSEVVAVLLDAGESAVAAEHKGRASEAYRNALIHLGTQSRDAHRVVERANALKVQWETARSILSLERIKIQMI
jgi:hypothetical protein